MKILKIKYFVNIIRHVPSAQKIDAGWLMWQDFFNAENVKIVEENEIITGSIRDEGEAQNQKRIGEIAKIILQKYVAADVQKATIFNDQIYINQYVKSTD